MRICPEFVAANTSWCFGLTDIMSISLCFPLMANSLESKESILRVETEFGAETMAFLVCQWGSISTSFSPIALTSPRSYKLTRPSSLQEKRICFF